MIVADISDPLTPTHSKFYCLFFTVYINCYDVVVFNGTWDGVGLYLLVFIFSYCVSNGGIRTTG